MEEVIVVKEAQKNFGQYKVFENINVTFNKSTITGIVGRNGSGKTVLFKSILGFLMLDEGEIIVRGEKVGDDIDIVSNVGTIIESPGFLPNFTGFDNLWLLASINNKLSKEDVKKTIEKVGLDAISKKKVSQYSMGMRQRLGIAQAIMEDPDILILDEPMSGLDTDGVKLIRELLLNLKNQGKTIILASHSSDDINILCDAVYRLQDRRLSKESTINRD